jgi:hypothetical protein
MTTTGTPAEAARLVHAEPVWDTVVSLQLVTCDPDVDLPAARDAVVRWVHLVDEVLSTFRPDSDLSRWRAGTCSLADCDPMVEEVLLLAGRRGGSATARSTPRGRTARPTRPAS